MGGKPVSSTQVMFRGSTYDLGFCRYANGRPGLTLNCPISGDPEHVATTNIPPVQIDRNCAFIKDYTENEGMLKALLDAGAIKLTGLGGDSGWVFIPVCELLVLPPWMREPPAETDIPVLELDHGRDW